MVIVLNPKEYKEQPIAEVGKEYHIFDDGLVDIDGSLYQKMIEWFGKESVEC